MGSHPNEDRCRGKKPAAECRRLKEEKARCALPFAAGLPERSLTYVLTGATEPYVDFCVGRPAHALPFTGGPPNTRRPVAADPWKTYEALNCGSDTLRLRMTPNSVPDFTSASASFS